jgi:hypothetical protein
LRSRYRLKCCDQLPEPAVRERVVADLPVEVDVGEDALQRGGVLLLQRGERLVEAGADVLVDLVAEVPPAGALRDVEGVA